MRTLGFEFLCVTIWIFGSGLAFGISEQSHIYFWEQFKYLGIVFISPLWLIFAHKWTGKEKPPAELIYLLLFAFSSVFLIFIFTDSIHHLFWSGIEYISIESYVVTSVEHGIIWWIMWIYSYLLLMGGTLIIFKGLMNLGKLYQKQAILLLIGIIAPWAANLMFAFNLTSFFDFTPIMFIITGIVYYWGISRFNLIGIIPVARNVVFRNLKDPILVVDSKDRIVDINSAMRIILDCPERKIVGKHIDEIFKNHFEILEKIKESDNPDSAVLIKGKRKDGWFDVQITPLFDKSNNTFGKIISFRNVTKVRMALNELKDAHELLFTINSELERKVKERTTEIERLIDQKNEFIKQLSHDLKTPLTPLMILIPILKKKIKNPKDKKLLETIIRNINYMKDIVIKTIDLAKLNSNKIEFNIEDTNLLTEVNNVIKNNKIIFDNNKIKIENKIDENILIKADKLRLDELLNNIITNSIKYTPIQGGEITIDAEEEKDFVTTSLKDMGIGMTKDQIDHIFDEFYKVDDSRHELDSSGLGMPICKRIVEKHGGKIWVESPGLGKGSTVYFTIPSTSKTIIKNEKEKADISKKVDELLAVKM